MKVNRMLRFSVRKKRRIALSKRVKGVDVLYEQMCIHHFQAKSVIRSMLDLVREDPKANFAVMKDLLAKMRQCGEVAIDCAAKIAPYQTPKLETLEVKSKVEHKFVIEAPQPVASVTDWAKLTGAKLAKINKTETKRVLQPIKPSIHDFDDDEPGMIH
jgi:hypothetical protein